MAINSISTIEEANRVLQDLQDQINLLKNKPQNLHGRTSQQAQDPSSKYVTQRELDLALALKAVPPGTTNTGNNVSGILGKANIWRQLQTFLGGIFTKFVSIFSSGVIPSFGVPVTGGRCQFTMSVSQNNASPSAQQGFFLFDNTSGNAPVFYVNHNALLPPDERGTFWQDYFLPYTDNLWDIGKSSAGGIGFQRRWGGIYAMVARFEGVNSGAGAPIAAGAQGLDIGMNFISAEMGLASGIYQPLTITANPLTLNSDAGAAYIVVTALGFLINGNTSYNGSVALAKLTSGGANGSLTVTGGIITAYTPPT